MNTEKQTDTVLLVDDNPGNIKLIATILQEKGHNVSIAKNGLTGLKRAEYLLPDIILLDINMPVMNGFETCEKLKKNPKTKNIPVIFLSSYDETVDKLRGFAVGGIDYITKPVEPIEVIARLRLHLQHQKTQNKLKEANAELNLKNEELKYANNELEKVKNKIDLERTQFLSILDSIPELIYVSDFDTNEILFVNQKLKDIVGRDVVGEKCFAALQNGNQACDFCTNKYILNHDKPYYWEHYNPILNRHFFIMDRRIQWPNHKNVRFELAIDITQRKKMEVELKKANAELEHLTNTDGLTSIYNRRYFDLTIQREWKRHSRTGAPLSLVLCDIDFFKKFNDTYGHQAGDVCLRKVAQTLQKAVGRPSDLAARYGGEEFVILLPETDSDAAIIVGERARAAVQQLNIPHSTSLVKPIVSISMGIATTIPNQSDDPESLVRLADQMLYKSKEKGRDQVQVAEKVNRGCQLKQ